MMEEITRDLNNYDYFYPPSTPCYGMVVNSVFQEQMNPEIRCGNEIWAEGPFTIAKRDFPYRFCDDLDPPGKLCG